uniref:Uncharacterized protein n=1 Tax=Oryza meridionalis TaxID=40149 RepID=A0A0E0EDD7_9ORYZ
MATTAAAYGCPAVAPPFAASVSRCRPPFPRLARFFLHLLLLPQAHGIVSRGQRRRAQQDMREQKARLYIIRQCIVTLLCYHD